MRVGINASLLEFIQPQQLNQIKIPNKISEHRTLVCLFYLIGIVMGEITWILINIAFGYEKLQMPFVMISAIAWASIWSIFGLYKKYMSCSQFLFWMQGCFHTLMFVLARLLFQYHFILCGCSVGIVFFIILQMALNRKVTSSKFYFYLYIWYVLVYYELISANDYKTNWLTMIMLDVYVILGVVVFVMLKWRSLTYYSKWQALCMVFPWSIIVTLCLIGSLPEREFGIPRQWFGVINHLVFVLLCAWMIRQRKKLLPQWMLKEGTDVYDDRQKLYQVSECLLAPYGDYSFNPRASMAEGKPLANCLLCFNKQSSFCYENCKHVCVCDDPDEKCAQKWMEKGDKKCPFCRVQSNTILQIQRTNGMLFAINYRYKIISSV